MDATFCKTIAGNGFKIAIDGKWLYEVDPIDWTGKIRL